MASELTHALLLDHLHYDPLTGVFTRRLTVGRHGRWKAGDEVGYRNKDGYVILTILSRHHRANRVAWFYVTGKPPTGEVDHIDTIKHHNWFTNLRDATGAVNQQNRRRANRNNRSGLLGVSWYARGKCWRARIYVDGREHRLGNFTSKKKAHKVYVAAKRQLHEGNTL